MPAAPDIRIKRVYLPPEAGDGARILVDRLWPRGLRKETAALAGWQRDAAPTPALRQWFGHDPARWPAFRQSYEAELTEARPAAVEPLLRLARQGPLTLLYAARDEQHNHAIVLAEHLRQRLRART